MDTLVLMPKCLILKMATEPERKMSPEHLLKNIFNQMQFKAKFNFELGLPCVGRAL